ncbi:MAG: DUF4215 domain-containing protein [Myxococcales bacterium]|nr:DUF4215 domain-containing protein [Myxococcales bacterium]
MFASKSLSVACVLGSIGALACVDIRFVDDDGTPGGSNTGGFATNGGSSTFGGFTPAGGFDPSGGFSSSGGAVPVGGFDPSGGFSTVGGGPSNGGFDPQGGAGGGPTMFCGDGVVGPGEECDGANLGGASCQDLGYLNPAGMVCNAICDIDASGCQAVCGNGFPEPGEQCDDGNLASGDGCSPMCTNEENPCDVASPITLNTMSGSVVLTGTTVGAPSQLNAGPGCTNASGPEVVYQITTVQDGFVTAWIDGDATTFDSVLYGRNTCQTPGAALGCHDNDEGAGAGEVLSNWVPAGSTLYIVVDGANGASGDYELHLDLSRGGGCPDPAPITIEGSAPIVLSGSTASLTTDTQAFGCSGAGNGNDSAYQVTFKEAGNYTFDIQSSVFNTIAHARVVCGTPSTEVDCDNPPGNNSQLNFTVNAGDTRFVWVDANNGPTGAYTVTITH